MSREIATATPAQEVEAARTRTKFHLAEDERRYLGVLEDTIERGLRSFVEVGEALAEIRDDRLYRETQAAFDDYCRERWGFSKSHANRQIEAAEVVDVLTPIGVKPTNEAQVRELAALKGEPELVSQVWVEVVEEHSGKPTAKHVREAVERHRPKPPPAQQDYAHCPTCGQRVRRGSAEG